MVNTFLNNYFGFNKQQRNGLLVLMFISLILLTVRITYPYFMKPGDILLENLPLIVDSTQKDEAPALQEELFYFDPNTASAAELHRLGLSEKTAGTLIKFRSSFGFRQKKDLLKVYGIGPKLFEKLEPFIRIGKQADVKAGNRSANTPQKSLATYESGKQTQQIIDLNTADSAALTTVRGIGPVFAKRIIKYRTLLGGFVKVEQLIEVYGFDEEKYSAVSSYFTVTASGVKKIRINTDDFKTVNRHPYISYELTKTLFDWRRKTTINATNLKDILNDETLYGRLLPYLEF